MGWEFSRGSERGHWGGEGLNDDDEKVEKRNDGVELVAWEVMGGDEIGDDEIGLDKVL